MNDNWSPGRPPWWWWIAFIGIVAFWGVVAFVAYHFLAKWW